MSSASRSRGLRFENLEERRLLAVSQADFAALSEIYSELEWTESPQELNVIEITAEMLSENALLNAIREAAESEANDLIVLRTTDTARSIELSEPLSIDLNSRFEDSSLTVVALGDASLRLFGDSSTLVDVLSGTVQFGGVSFFTSVNSLAEQNADAVVCSGENATVCYSRSLFGVGVGEQIRADLLAVQTIEDEDADSQLDDATLSADFAFSADFALFGDAETSLLSSEVEISDSDLLPLAGTTGQTEIQTGTQTAGQTTLERESGTYYSLEFQLGSSTQWLYVTGLDASDVLQIEDWLTSPVTSSSDRVSLSGLFLDAEKSKSNTDDDLMCWAASLSNMLTFTGWANDSLAWDENGDPLFTNEDDVFEYLCEHFEDNGGHSYYGADWFITGNYSVAGKSGWSQIEQDGGAFYAGDYSFSTIATHETITVGDSSCSLESMTDYLQNGWAVGLGLSISGQGHAVTCWGYVYDTQYEETDPLRYSALLTTDSDDSKTSDNPPNNLWLSPLAWDDASQKFLLVGYSVSDAVLNNYAALAPYSSKVELSTDDGGTLSRETIAVGDEFSLVNVAVSAGAEEASHAFTISVYASEDSVISADSDFLLGEFNLDGVARGNVEYFTLSGLSTLALTEGDWHIGWIVESGLDADSSDNSGLCSATLTVSEKNCAIQTSNHVVFSSQSLIAGESFDISEILVQNTGDSDFGSVVLSVYASEDSHIDSTGDVLLASTRFDSLDAASERYLSFDSLSSEDWAPGSWSVYWTLTDESGTLLDVGLVMNALQIEQQTFTAQDYSALLARYERLDLPELDENGEIPESLNIQFLGGKYSWSDVRQAVASASACSGDNLIVLSTKFVQELAFTSADDELKLNGADGGRVVVAVLDENGGVLKIDANEFCRFLTVTPYSNLPALDLLVGGIEFANGKVTDARGGAIYVLGGSFTAEECLFTNNQAVLSSGGSESYGGAICSQGTVRLFEGTASGNSSESSGGFIFNFADFYAEDFLFEENSAVNGGAVYSQGTDVFLACQFHENFASSSGGAVGSLGKLTASQCLFTENTATNYGGAVYGAVSGSRIAELNFVSTLLAENSADKYGGAICAKTLVAVNSTFTGNSASYGSGILLFEGGNGATLVNSIYLEEGESPLFLNSTAQLTAKNSLLDSVSMSRVSSAEDCLTYSASLPLFTDPDNGDYSLSENSQALDAGSNSAFLAALELSEFSSLKDVAGNARLQNEIVDIGAFERPFYVVDGITLNAPSVVFDGRNHLPDVAGILPGDTVLFSLDGTTFSDSVSCLNVGDYSVSVKVLRDGYAEWTGTVQFSIAPCEVAVAWEETEFIYSASEQTVVAWFTDVLGEKRYLAVVFDNGKAFRNVGAYSAQAVWDDGNDENSDEANYVLTNASQTLQINPKAVSASVQAESREYDAQTSVVLNWSLDGAFDGDDVQVVGVGAFCDANAGEDKEATISDVRLIGRDAENYVLNETPTSAYATIFWKSVSLAQVMVTKVLSDSVRLTIGETESASGYEILCSDDSDFTNILVQKQTNDAGSFLIEGLEGETTYFVSVRALGEGNFCDSQEKILLCQTGESGLLLEPVCGGTLAERWILEGEEVSLNGIQIRNGATSASDGFWIKIYAVSLDGEGEPILLNRTFCQNTIHANELAELSVELDGSSLTSGKYSLYCEVSTKEATQDSATDSGSDADAFSVGNFILLEETLTVLTPVQTTVTTVTTDGEPDWKSEISELNEWSEFSVDLWTESDQGDYTVLLAFNSSLFQLAEVPFWTVSGVTVEMERLSQNFETGMCEILVSLIGLENDATAPTLENEENGENVSEGLRLAARLFLVPVSGNGVECGGYLTSAIQINRQDVVERVSSVPFDLNDDGSVNIQDLVFFASVFGVKTNENSQYALGDFNGDAYVDISDLVLFASYFGESAPVNASTHSVNVSSDITDFPISDSERLLALEDSESEMLSSGALTPEWAGGTPETSELERTAWAPEMFDPERRVLPEKTAVSLRLSPWKFEKQKLEILKSEIERSDFLDVPGVSGGLANSFSNLGKRISETPIFSETNEAEDVGEADLCGEFSRRIDFHILDEIFGKEQKFPF